MTEIAQFLPWHRELAANWLGQRERFAHAWLIHGLPGIGKRDFALAAAASLLCESPRHGLACNECAACHWFAAGNHPDLRRIRPEALALQEGAAAGAAQDDAEASGGASKKAPSKEIRVEQLRSLSSWFNTATHRGGWRVAILYPAGAMNSITANALLKVLEEPPEHTVFLLVADAPDRLLPTLVSRCRRLPLPVPDKTQSLSWLDDKGLANPDQWLAAAGGAPLLAFEWSGIVDTPCPGWLTNLLASLAQAPGCDIGPTADELEKQPAEAWIDTLQRAFVDLLLAAADAPLRYYPVAMPHIQRIAKNASGARLSETAKWLAQQRAVAGHPLNAKLFVHSVLQRVAMACNPAVSPQGQ